MNYGEQIAYWYLRLNGFFLLNNFVIHKSARVTYAADADLLGIRLPHVYEPIGGEDHDWDGALANLLNFDRPIALICEVKTGDYDEEDLFRDQYLEYAIGRFGLIPRGEIEDVTRALTGERYIERLDGSAIGKILIANELTASDRYIGYSLEAAEDFIIGRATRYADRKYADRMHFPRDYFQQVIHQVHRHRMQGAQDGQRHR